jgi:ubiquinone/menaquinone biosynthesis C-methylase UbiE
MTISDDMWKKEGLRSHLFQETWQNLIPEVFRDVPTYYDKGNAVASLGNCSRWSNTFAAAIHCCPWGSGEASLHAGRP